MPHIAHTPESLLPRSDSRNPTTTCRGITVHGRPCRRTLAPLSPPKKSQTRHESDPRLYCWQHKDQAGSSTAWPIEVSNGFKPRSSIDTLLDRLGVLEINDEQPVRKQHEREPRPANNIAEVSEKRRPAPKTTFCCFEIVDEDENYTPPKPVSRPAQRHVQTRPAHAPLPAQDLYYTTQRPSSVRRPQSTQTSSSATSGRYYSRPSSRPRASSIPQTSSRPTAQQARNSSSSSQTQSLLAWFSPGLEPQTTSLLLTELTKPISNADEQGYIYMFWLTPTSTGTRSELSPREIASSLLPPAPSSNNTRRPVQPRSISDALRAAQDLNALTQNPTPGKPDTIRLKIGRTSNVHRRLTQWTRQCSHDLTLIRYYPYTPSSTSRPRQRNRKCPTPDLLPGRKVPHVHRVERLIHLELADLRARDLGRCGECGKEHREWFEVEARKEALRRVDECVRRWVAWGETV